MTLGLANGVRREPRQLLSALTERGHESVEFFVINMLIEWTSQDPDTPYNI